MIARFGEVAIERLRRLQEWGLVSSKPDGYGERIYTLSDCGRQLCPSRRDTPDLPVEAMAA
jgi:DNA-binding PadR family transcriptional regulator